MVVGMIRPFLAGVAWAVILSFYRRFVLSSNPLLADTSKNSPLLIVVDILFVGGGTGVMLYLANNRFPDLAYSILGILLVSAGAILVDRVRESA